MESWKAWRTRLAALRRAIDEHLREAEALSARMSQTPSRGRGGREPDSGDEAESTPLCGHAAGTAAGSDADASIRSPEVTRALDHLERHYERPLRLVDLALVAGCSRERLVRAFRRETGSTVHAHLVRLRLTRAARDVGAGDKIEAVMLGVGYRGKRNFYRQFKARFGTTPGGYRAALRRRVRDRGDTGPAATAERSLSRED
jgi:transcriptional regulator GlxA family with amidase domain